MYVNIAVLKETAAHERRFATVHAVAARLQQLGGRLNMQPGAAASIDLPHAAFLDVIFIEDVKALVSEADVVLAVQAPDQTTIAAMREGAIPICFLDEHNAPELVKALQLRKITCFAMQSIPRISRAHAMVPC